MPCRSLALSAAEKVAQCSDSFRRGGRCEIGLKLRRESVAPARPPNLLNPGAMIIQANQILPAHPLRVIEHPRLMLIPCLLVQFEEAEKKIVAITRSSWLAAVQSVRTLARAVPSAGDWVAGTLMAAIAAMSDSTATTRCDWVFCWICRPTKMSDPSTPTAPAICANSESYSSVTGARIADSRAPCTQEIGRAWIIPTIKNDGAR